MPLRDLAILVVEDEPIIFVLLEDMLHELGCVKILHATTVERALALLGEQKPDAAVLDVNLGTEKTYPVAAQLDACEIPFLFATGQGRNGMAPAWATHAMLQKPFDTEALRRALCMVLARN